MDAVAEPDPSLLPTTAVQEVGVKAAEVAGQQYKVGPRYVPRMGAWIAHLIPPDGQRARRVHTRFDLSLRGVDTQHLVDQECLARIWKRRDEALELKL